MPPIVWYAVNQNLRLRIVTDKRDAMYLLVDAIVNG